MRYGSEAYLFFPGGFGTLDELMETLTLVQTQKVSRMPIILVGVDFWQPLDDFIKKDLAAEHMIGESDPSLYVITDDEDAILEIIKNAPVRKSM
jgi:predicted Rossmann-fold nucleotide-binding protein